MTLDELAQIADNYENYCLYAPWNMGVRLGCECCGGDSYTIEDWSRLGELHDVAEQDWDTACRWLKIVTKDVQDELFYALVAYSSSKHTLDCDGDDFVVEDVLEHLDNRLHLEKILCKSK